MPDAAQALGEFLARARQEREVLNPPVPKPPKPPPTVEELAALGAKRMAEKEAKLQQTYEDLQDGDVEVDPELLELGEEVAEETLTQFKRLNFARVESWGLQDSARQQSEFSEGQRRAAVQRAHDLMLVHGMHRSGALKTVAGELGISKDTVSRWADQLGIEVTPQVKTRPRNEQWNIDKREELFDRQMEVVSHLTDRMMVWLQYRPEDDPDGTGGPPADWNAATEIKTIAVAAAILHDKRTGLEDLRISRGLVDTDSEELQGGLDHGRQRLLEMNNGKSYEVSRAGTAEAESSREGEGGEGTEVLES